MCVFFLFVFVDQYVAFPSPSLSLSIPQSVPSLSLSFYQYFCQNTRFVHFLTSWEQQSVFSVTTRMRWRVIERERSVGVKKRSCFLHEQELKTKNEHRKNNEQPRMNPTASSSFSRLFSLLINPFSSRNLVSTLFSLDTDSL